MIGYVLWSDATVGKAIIWCEDQGDLAYYSGKGETAQVVVCKGDWVRFDLTEVGNIRLAANASVLDEHGLPELADMLIETASTDVKQAHPPSVLHTGGNVIPFPVLNTRSKTARFG